MCVCLTQCSHQSLNSPKKKSYPRPREEGTWSCLSYDSSRSGALKKHKPFPKLKSIFTAAKQNDLEAFQGERGV